MLSLADAINGWLQETWPGFYFDNHRIFDHQHHHVICVFADGENCLGKSTTIVPASDPEFFEQLQRLVVNQLGKPKEER